MELFKYQCGQHQRPQAWALARRGLLAALLLGAIAPAQVHTLAAPANPPILLTNAQQIAALGTNISPRTFTVKLHVVVFYVSGPRRFYAQDGELGLQVNLSADTTVRVSQLVEVTGTVLGGEPMLRLADARATVLGDGALPEPELVSAHRLVRGDHPFCYVALRGVVRDMTASRNSIMLLLTDNAFPFEVVIQTTSVELPRHWLDGEIEVRGFSYPAFSNGRATGFRFWAAGTNFVQVLSPGIADRFDGRPLLTLAEAARVPQDFKPRIRVAGTVTVHRPSIAFYIDDGTGVMNVELLRHLPMPADGQHLGHEPQTTLEPGERVEVIGVRHNWYSLTPTLILAEYRRMGQGQPAQPIHVSLFDLQAGRYAGRLVNLTARLLDHRAWATSRLMNYQVLTFRLDDDVFQVRWESEKLARWDLKSGSYYQIVGVNDVDRGSSGKQNTFQILVRSPADVTAAAPPPFWTRKEFRRIALAVGGVGVLAGALILLQRWQLRRLERHVAERTADLSGANEQLQREVAQRRTVEQSLRASEARLRESEELFSKAFHGSNARLAILDAATGRYLDVNDAFVQAYGYSREEILGRTSLDLGFWVDQAQRDEAYRIYDREGRLRDFETRVRTRSGEVQVVLQSGDFVTVGERRCILSVGIDITDRKRVEAELLQNYAREKELNELKSRFVAMVSHEFRTPLAIITSSAEILEAYLERLPEEERQANLRDITDATRHMSRMMEQVLLLGRVEAGKMTCHPAPHNLVVFGQRLVDEVISATNNRCPIQFTAAPGLPEAQADEGLLRHIFTNLLANAVKYSPAGSPVEFKVEARGHLALFTVRDRGIGIPEADARLLFQAFHRGRNVGETPGTGLGMTIIKRCVELHGGRIGFESKEGQGTTFLVALPLFGASSGGNGEHTTQLIRAAVQTDNLTFEV